jgi:hypothetical protein
MLLFAVNVIHRLKALPRKDVVNFGIALLMLLVIILLIKMAARMNRFILGIVIVVVTIVVLGIWVYERNEPKFLSGFIDSIAPYFPGPVKYKN